MLECPRNSPKLTIILQVGSLYILNCVVLLCIVARTGVAEQAIWELVYSCWVVCGRAVVAQARCPELDL